MEDMILYHGSRGGSNRIGKTYKMNNGMNATIVVYRSASDIDVKFEDGTIVEHKSYNKFLNGNIGYPKDYSKRIGETQIMNNGLKATIIAYRNSKNIDIQFENGEIVKSKSYASFVRGYIKLESLRTETLLAQKRHVGEKRIMNNGMEAELIEYYAKENVTIKFEDGVIKTNILYNNFKKGIVAHPQKTTKNIKAEKKYLNQVTKMNNGMLAKIITYRTDKDIDVEFEDGAVVKNRTFFDFKRGTIGHPIKPQAQRLKNQQVRIGETNFASNGQKMTVIEYRSCNDIDIEFEDGTVVNNTRYDRFIEGTIANPNYLLLSGVSCNELVLSYYLESYGFYKSYLSEMNGKELDLYNPNFYGHKVAIEYDGYIRIDNNSHTIEKDIDKNQLCIQNNIHLFRIREPHLPLLNSSSVDIKLSSKKQLSRSLELALKILVKKLEKLCKIQMNIDIDFERDKEQIFEYIKKYHNKFEKERIGQKSMMNCGMRATIIEYINSENINIQFEDGAIKKNVKYFSFLKGTCAHPNINSKSFKVASKYIGISKMMRNGLKATIIKYRNYNDIDVQFENGIIVKNRRCDNFMMGKIKCPA